VHASRVPHLRTGLLARVLKSIEVMRKTGL